MASDGSWELKGRFDSAHRSDSFCFIFLVWLGGAALCSSAFFFKQGKMGNKKDIKLPTGNLLYKIMDSMNNGFIVKGICPITSGTELTFDYTLEKYVLRNDAKAILAELKVASRNKNVLIPVEMLREANNTGDYSPIDQFIKFKDNGVR